MESEKTPTFASPEKSNLFLGSSFGLHSYEDLDRFERFFLQFLVDYEHDFSKPVEFLALSSDTLIFAMAACWKLGIPFVPFDPKAPVKENAPRLEQIDIGLLFADKKYLSELEFENLIDIGLIDLQHALKEEVVFSYDAENFSPNTDQDHVFGYFFTSGTTGTPKIVPLKRRQMLVAAKSSAENIKPRANHFWLLCLPLNHIGGVSIILRSLLYGSAIFRMKSFHPDIITTFLTENKLFQAASLVPTMLKQLLDTPSFHIHNKFKAILLGGGPIDPEMVKRCHQKGIPLVPSYGMTETCAQIAANPLHKPSGTYTPIKSAGYIFSPNKIKIRDQQQNDIGVNNMGTIWLKGPQVFDGYLNHNDSDKLVNGWFNTGDYGYLNANGQLFIESRREDLIITGGENVSPIEVESELKKITPIEEAAVIGLPDKKWGEKVVAVVVAKTNQKINATKIKEKLKKQLTGYKIPKEIIQIETLPRNKTGKLLRTELRKLFKE